MMAIFGAGRTEAAERVERDERIRFYVSGYNEAASDAGIYTFDLLPGSNGMDVAGKSAGIESPSWCSLQGDRLYAASETPDHGGLAVYDLGADDIPVLQSEAAFPDAAGTCYALADVDRGAIYGADYNSGSVSFAAIDGGGSIEQPVVVVQHGGHGAPRDRDDISFDRQRAPHVHTLSLPPQAVEAPGKSKGADAGQADRGGNLLAAVDLGLDLIAIYATDDSGAIVDAAQPTVLNVWVDPLSEGIMTDGARAFAHGDASYKLSESAYTTAFEELPTRTDAQGNAHTPVRLTRTLHDGTGSSIAELPMRPAAIIEAPIYAGPRIVAYHPTKPIAALICELACEVILFEISPDALHWKPFARYNLLDEASDFALIDDAGKPPLSAHAAFTADGRFLYTCTRGTNTMTTFAIDEACNVTDRFATTCGGGTPRHFALSPNDDFLVVANQTSSDVAIFRRDALTGKLSQIDGVMVNTPSCIIWR